MRNRFVDALSAVAASDPRPFLITGDLGFSVLERFRDKYPERFLNAGVAEQNMTGLAAGLALAGHHPFTYSIANFPTLRCLEQIRNDICYHNLPVCIVAVGGGVAYGAAGYSHHAVEDLAIMRALDGMTVLAPADPIETACAVEAIVAAGRPTYLRLGKGGEPNLHDSKPDFFIGKPVTFRAGEEVCLAGSGPILGNMLAAATELARHGVNARVLGFHTIWPHDREALRTAFRGLRDIFFVEEHLGNPLFASVAETLPESFQNTRVHLLSLDRAQKHALGSRDYLLSLSGLHPEGIAEHVHRALASHRMSVQV
ncbi:putative 33.6 kDa protein in fasciation locus (plasmid) [Methylovirgula sp. HY1]|nr:putative 33.6 kDa protein in fasciation locus [Methylovirgula sp. HY1]